MSNYGPKLIVPYRPLMLDRNNTPQAIMTDEEETRAARVAFQGLLASEHKSITLSRGDYKVTDIGITDESLLVPSPTWSAVRNSFENGVSYVSINKNSSDKNGDLDQIMTENNSYVLRQGEDLDFDVLVVVQRLTRDLGYAATLALAPQEITDSSVFRFDAYWT